MCSLLTSTGYVLGPRVPGAPEFYVSVDGILPNGIPFGETLVASAAEVTAVGERVTGVWEGVGGFQTSEDLSSFSVHFEGLNSPVTGTITMNANAIHHYACNGTTSPYFDSAIPEGELTENEKIFYQQVGWAITIPGGNATVDLHIEDTPLFFQGSGYHDQNWFPQLLSDIVATWSFGAGQAGPYTFSYIEVQTIDSNRTFTTGFLARDGVVLQNQCNTETTGNDRSILTPYGIDTESTSGVLTPKGYIVDYLLANGEHFSFNITALGRNPDLSIYHRSTGTAVGGKVGGNSYKGSTLFEWLNPGLVPYISK